MAERETTTNDSLERVWGEISTLGLEAHIADLDAHGYTVIAPEIASPGDLAERTLTAVMDVAERRNGVRPDLETGGRSHFRAPGFDLK
jgi:hypothetical protein